MQSLAVSSKVEYDLEHDGFTILRGFFEETEMASAIAEADRLFQMSQIEREEISEEIRWIYGVFDDGTKVLRGLQNAFLISETFNRLRNDQRLWNTLVPALGKDIKSPVCTLFWKPPGEKASSVAYHQDCSFRRPKESFRNLASSYLQVGIALEAHGPENGGMLFLPGSHKKGDLEINRKTSVLIEDPQPEHLVDWGLEGTAPLAIRLSTGDIVVWSAYLLHGSPPNPSKSQNRRFFVNGYMRSDDCDVGDEVFSDFELGKVPS